MPDLFQCNSFTLYGSGSSGLGNKKLFFQTVSSPLECGGALFHPADGLAHATVVAVAQCNALPERSAPPSRRVPIPYYLLPA